MNILKHMEAVFVATVVFAVSGSYLVDAVPQAHAKPAIQASAAVAVPVVVVSAKRMSAAEKQQSLQAEAGQPASRI
jgi:hypothetical protein